MNIAERREFNRMKDRLAALELRIEQLESKTKEPERKKPGPKPKAQAVG